MAPLRTVLPTPRASRTILAFLLFAVLSMGAAGARAAATVLVLGDSLSSAYGLPERSGWVALLAERLRRERPDYTVVNASVAGETSSGGRARLPRLLAMHRPRVLVLALGGNDGLRGLAPALLRDNLSAMVAEAERAGARVLLAGVRLPPNYGAAYTREFEAAYAEVARRHRLAFVPDLLAGVTEDLFQSDRIHPGAAAQPLLLERVWPALLPLLGPAPRR